MSARPGFIRSDIEPIIGREHGMMLDYDRAEQGSAKLRRSLKRMFRAWERAHGFQDGAGEILLPSGYRP